MRQHKLLICGMRDGSVRRVTPTHDRAGNPELDGNTDFKPGIVTQLMQGGLFEHVAEPFNLAEAKLLNAGDVLVSQPAISEETRDRLLKAGDAAVDALRQQRNAAMQATIEREVRKMLLPDENGQPVPHITEDLARRWVTALAYGGLTEDEAHAIIVELCVPGDVVEHVAVDAALHDNVDRAYRDAWCLDKAHPTGIGHDMAKARDIHRDKLRRLRAPKMRDLDIAFSRALEAEDKAKQRDVISLKQALRDAPADLSIDAAKTVEELKAAVPACLR